MLPVFCLECRIIDRELTVVMIGFLFIYIQLWLSLPSTYITAAIYAFGELDLELVAVYLKSIGNKTLAYNVARLLQRVCCWEPVTLVSSGVLGKDCRAWGLCAWNWNHTLHVLPTSSARTQLCKLDMDYGGANNTVFMVPAERRMIRYIESETTERELQGCF